MKKFNETMLKIVPNQSDSVKCNSIKRGSCPNKCPRRKYHSPFLIITERDFILLNNGFCRWVGKEVKCVPKNKDSNVNGVKEGRRV